MKQLIILILGLSSGMLAYSATTITSAIYEVPADSGLQSVNKFKLKDVLVRAVGTKTQISFSVPEDLTGAKNVLVFSGEFQSGQGKLHSENGELNCKSLGTSLACKVNYMNLDFDQDRVDHILSSKLSGDRLQKTIVLQRQFSTDPVGIVHINFRK